MAESYSLNNLKCTRIFDVQHSFVFPTFRYINETIVIIFNISFTLKFMIHYIKCFVKCTKSTASVNLSTLMIAITHVVINSVCLLILQTVNWKTVTICIPSEIEMTPVCTADQPCIQLPKECTFYFVTHYSQPAMSSGCGIKPYYTSQAAITFSIDLSNEPLSLYDRSPFMCFLDPLNPSD